MSVVLGATALCVDQNNKNIILAGVGHLIKVYKGDKIHSSFQCFNESSRILDIFYLNGSFITFARNCVKKVSFDAEYINMKTEFVKEMIDDVLKVSFNKDHFEAILHHGQIATFTDDSEIEVTKPPVWVLATAAHISENFFIYGDAFGTIFMVNKETKEMEEFKTKYGTMFGIDYNEETGEICTAQEYHAFALFSPEHEEIWSSQDYTSRCWGCRFIGDDIISYGEDGFIRFKNGRTIHAHRVRNVTAMIIVDDEIITAGDDATIVRFKIPPQNQEYQKYQIQNTTAICACNTGDVYCALKDGSIIDINGNTIIEKNEGTYWFSLKSCGSYVCAASRKNTIVFFNKDKNVHFQTQSVAVAFSVFEDMAAVVFSNNFLMLYDLNEEKEILSEPFSLSQHCTSTPLCVALSAKELAISTVSGAVIFDIAAKDFNKYQSVDNVATDGILAMLWIDDVLYCAGKTDCAVYIIKQEEGTWLNKYSWRVPLNCRSICGLDESNDKTLLISATTKKTIMVWDLESQTCVSQFPYTGNKLRIVTKRANDVMIGLWNDAKTVNVIEEYIMPSKRIEPMFHGLRCLCSASKDDLMVTGGCDRDIRLWKITNEIEECDAVQGPNSGTHALTFCGDYVIGGGTDMKLYSWKLSNNKLYKGSEFDFTKFGFDDGCKYKVSSLATISATKIIVGMNNASIVVVDFDNGHMTYNGTYGLPGVPMHICVSDKLVSISTSVGKLIVYDTAFTEFKEYETCCGIHCSSFINNEYIVVGCDDTFIRLLHIGDSITEALEIEGHVGGVKSVHAIPNTTSVVSFSYDQIILHSTIDLSDMKVETKCTSSPISEGVSSEIFGDNIVTIGNGIFLTKI